MFFHKSISKKKNNYSIKYISIFCIILISFKSIINIKKIENTKICLCTIGKEENLYAREYVSYYKNYNLDKIFIYDNNEINGEKFEDVIGDYISSGFVEIINIRGKLSQQIKVYQHCFDNNKNKFDWIIFYDMDEYLYLKKPKNIKYYLSKRVFNKCEAIQLNMYFHTDNNQLYYKNESLAKRFTERRVTKIGFLKTILRGNVQTKIYCPHELNRNLISCDGFGQFNIKFKGIIKTYKPDFKYYYIDHFSYKSTEEFIKKVMKGSAIKGKDIEMKYRKISWYFGDNKLTKEKVDLIENITNFNLSIYREKLKK